LANGGLFLIGARRKMRGLTVGTLTSANANAAVLSAHYWNGAWTTLSPSDGTISSAKTFAQAGDITWTTPTDWTRASLRTIYAMLGSTVLPPKASTEQLFWTRLSVNAALSATVTVQAITPLAGSTAYAELATGVPLSIDVGGGLDGVCAVEALTDGGTAKLLVNVGAGPLGFD
jgi:hypothetical protein